MADLRLYLRHSVRRIAKSPGVSLIIIATMALGIGANTAIFSIVNAVLLTPLPYAEPNRLVTINHFYPSLNNLFAPVSPLGFRSYRERATAFSTLAASTSWGVNLSDAGNPERVQGLLVTGDYFRTYGVEPVLGRTIGAADVDRGEPVVVLSEGFWRRRFGADPQIVGRTIRLDDRTYQVMGVMPRRFSDFFSSQAEIWAPLVLRPQQFSGLTTEWLTVIGSLAPGVEVDRAADEMRRIAEEMKLAHPGAAPEDWTLTLTRLEDLAAGPLRNALFVLVGAVGFVLLIACANVANLLLARAAGRSREVAVRRALGASRRHVLADFLTESLLLAGVGGALGVLLAAWSVDAVRALGSLQAFGGLSERAFSIDGRVLAFTAAIAAATGVLFGFAPAIQAAGTDMLTGLREGGRAVVAGRSGRALRRGLVVGQVALALTLLTGAALMIKSFYRLQAVSPGFVPDGVLTFSLPLPQAKYDTLERQFAMLDEAVARIEAIPNVRAVGFTSAVPFSGNSTTSSFNIQGYTPPPGQPSPWGDVRIVSHGLAAALGLPLLRGRFFTEHDRGGTLPVAVIDEEFARRYFAGQDPLGQRIFFGTETETTTFIEIVGVVGHAKHQSLNESPRIQLYLPYRQTPFGMPNMGFALRTAGSASSVLPAVRRAIQEIDPAQPLANVATMEELIGESVGRRRLSTSLLGVFAGLAVLLAVLGIYGVMSYVVAERAQEVGVRMALGAGRPSIVKLFIGQGMRLAGAGVALGFAGAVLLTRLLEGQLYEVRASDPMVFVLAPLLLTAVALLAALVPSLRATRVDPLSALRAD